MRETALIIDAAWHGTYYGPVVWFATTTGARLGELCALRWRDLTIQHRDIVHDTDGHDPLASLVEQLGQGPCQDEVMGTTGTLRVRNSAACLATRPTR